MRLDCRLYVRGLALAATLFVALGLNSASYAQSLNALANMKNAEFVLDLSWPRTLPPPATHSVAHPPRKIVRSINQKPTRLWEVLR